MKCDMKATRMQADETGEKQEIFIPCSRERVLIHPTTDWGRLGLCTECHALVLRAEAAISSNNKARGEAKRAKKKFTPPKPLIWMRRGVLVTAKIPPDIGG